MRFVSVFVTFTVFTVFTVLMCGILSMQTALAADTSQFKTADAFGLEKNSTAAIDAALKHPKTQGIQNPKLIVTYFTEKALATEVVSKISQAYPSAKIFGQTVYRAVFTSSGLHLASQGQTAVAMMAFEGGDFSAGVAGAEIATDADAKRVATNVAKQAILNAGKGEEDGISVALVAPRRGSEDQVLAGLPDAFKKQTPLIGGTPTTDNFGGGVAIANNVVYLHGVVLAVIYTQHASGTSLHFSDVTAKGKSGVVTEASGRVLKSIDGKSAQEVYKGWANGKFNHLQAINGDLVTMETAVAPLAKMLTLSDGQTEFLTIRPQKFMKDGSLTMGGEVAVGETLYYVEADKDAFVKRAGAVTRTAIKNGALKPNAIAGGLHIYCAGASTVIGLQDNSAAANAMVKEMIDAMGGKPFIGGFTSAEQGKIAGSGYTNVNLTSSMAVFGK